MARAKRTARAEARRRHRAEQAAAGEVADENAEAPPATPAKSPSPATPAAGGRLSVGTAFRASFRPLDLRGDLRALPDIALHSKALWVPALITLVSTVLFAVTYGTQTAAAGTGGTTASPAPTGSPGASASGAAGADQTGRTATLLDLLSQFMFTYFVQTPPIGGAFLAGFLAPRASWLLGAIIGVLAAICYSALILVVFPNAPVPPTAAQAQELIIGAFILSPTMGALFAAAAAWYRRFLQYTNPNRGQRRSTEKRGADGRTRKGTANAKASASRR